MFLSIINDIATCIDVLGTIALLVFTIAYGARSPWRQFAAGRAMFYLAACCSLILVLGIYSTCVDKFGWPFPLRPVARVVVYGLVAGSFVRMAVTLLMYQHRRRSFHDELAELAKLSAPTEGNHD